MTVTEVIRDKKHCMRVETDSGRTVYIDRDVCSDYALSPGKILSDSELEEILERSGYVRAKERALWYLDRADHSEKALYSKLIRAGFSPQPCAAVIAWLREYGLVDDRRYAARFAERCAEANISGRAAYCKMLEKGVPRELAKQAIDALDTDEAAQIRALIDKKYRNKLTDRDSVRRVYEALVRRGFSFGAVRDVLKQYSEELQYASEE